MAQYCIASILGAIALIMKLNANKDPTNKKLVKSNFREIFLSCLAKICWINQIQKYQSKTHTTTAHTIFIFYSIINS